MEMVKKKSFFSLRLRRKVYGIRSGIPIPHTVEAADCRDASFLLESQVDAARADLSKRPCGISIYIYL